jgi:hypothetical protein
VTHGATNPLRYRTLDDGRNTTDATSGNEQYPKQWAIFLNLYEICDGISFAVVDLYPPIAVGERSEARTVFAC